MDKKKQINGSNIEQTVEVVDGFNKDALEGILRLEKECFPPGWQYEDADKYYSEMLIDKDNINILLKEGQKIVGYLLLKPHSSAFADLTESDTEMQDDPDRYYWDTIQVSPDHTGKGGAGKLMDKMVEELKKRGITKLAAHVRTSNRFNEKVKKYFEGSVTMVRKIESWRWGGEEPYEYIEWTV